MNSQANTQNSPAIRDHILDGTPADVVARYESLGQKAQAMDFGPLDRNVVVIDTETTGLSHHHDELIQIAAARLECGEITDWFVTFVDPGRPLSEEIVHLTGIRDADVAGAPLPSDALADLVEFVGDATLVAHNADFDRTFVTKHPAGYPLLDNLWIDSLDLSRIALPRLKSHRLIDLVHTFGAPVSTHRADDDVAATCVIYRLLLAAAASMPLSLLRAIGAMAPVDQWPTGRAFAILADVVQVESEEKTGENSAAPNAEPPVDSSAPFPDHPKAAPLFSLHALRRRRVNQLKTASARKDADELAATGTLEFPSEAQIDQAFTPQGLVGAIYPDFEPRPEQKLMAEAVRDAFAAGQNLVVEAGTGVGKSMAYLVTAALFAQKNDVTVGVATKTNALLDQLVFHELPALAHALAAQHPDAPALTWASLKGMGHYPCLRKINRLVDAGPQMKEVAGAQVSQAPALAALLSFIEQSEFSDLDSLKIDYRRLPRWSITSTSADCLRRKCPFFGKQCFAHGARRRAEAADVVVTNHALLFCNVAAEGALLPPIRYWVVDEAHSVEDEARAAFAQEVQSEAIERLVSRVGSSAGARSIFARAERALGDGNGDINADHLTQFLRLIAKAKQAAAAFESAAREYMPQVKDLLYFEPGAQGNSRQRRNQNYDHVDIWINQEVRHSQRFADLAARGMALVEEADHLIARLQDLVSLLEGIDEAAVAQREIAATTFDLRGLRNAAEIIFGPPSDAWVYQATLTRKKDRLNDVVQAQLLDVGQPMNELFFAQTHAVVFTSATLSVGGADAKDAFGSFQAAVGLGAGEFSPVRSLQLDSSYDFDNNMIVYVVSDMPEPNAPGYLDALNRLLVAAHRANGGSMLTLFTNRREMEKSHQVVADALRDSDLRVVCQKWGVSVKGLRDDFLADKSLSLFALKTFWEGFDAPGDTLRGVVIPKLPFGRPTDPLYCERASRDDRAWWHYVLPQAVIETKQAAGRLIRKADDRGVLILADKRLVTKGYGKTFLSSLPSRSVRVATADEVVAALELMDL